MTAHLPPASALFLALRSTDPAAVVRRAVIVIALVCGIFATSGWTAVRAGPIDPGPMAAALAAWRGVTVDGRPVPGPGAGPDRVARFFGSLSEPQRTRLAAQHPLVVGNLDGTPVALRYRANRIALADARRTERARLHDPALSPEGQAEAAERLESLDSLRRPGRQILAFDPTDRGRVAEVVGDLQEAERVAVTVPGVDTGLTTFEQSGEERDGAPAGMAHALHAAERRRAPHVPTAVVAWADYATPAGLGIAAASADSAEAGSRRLRRMLGALPGEPETALFCHSYGSVVCGLAAPDLPPAVTDIAAFGSPGMRAGSAADLRTRAHVWAARSDSDWIEDVPHVELLGLGHGADPMAPSFGARVVSAAGAEGHAGYFAPGTASLANFTAIALGDYGAVVPAGAG